MQLGMIGLGRMGGNMVIRLTKAGHDCLVYDSHHEAVDALVAKGAGGTLFLETDDCQAAYDELSARGLKFNDPPTAQPYGIDTSFRDPSGNNIRLTQVLEFDPARG